MVICLETASNLCSVALCDSNRVIAVKESHESKSHASLLTIYIRDILEENTMNMSDIEAIAVSKGPGSYTGLRIGVSVAKGIAYGASLPLIGIETPLSMFWGISETHFINRNEGTKTLFCPMLDARRMEVYYAIYDSNGAIIKDISAEIIDENSFSSINESTKIIFFGDGAAKCKNIIKRAHSVFADEFEMSASHMRIPVYKAIKTNKFEDVAYFEPYYLKDFITSKPRKNILGQ